MLIAGIVVPVGRLSMAMTGACLVLARIERRSLVVLMLDIVKTFQ